MFDYRDVISSDGRNTIMAFSRYDNNGGELVRRTINVIAIIIIIIIISAVHTKCAYSSPSL